MARKRSTRKTPQATKFTPQLLALEDRFVPAFLIRTAAADDVAGITAARDGFRADLGGGTTAGANGSFGGVRREINWDGVPAAKAAPNNLPADFFNTNSPRGVLFSTAGTGFQVSGNAADAGAGQPALEFSNLNAGYPALFDAFSPQRLFTPVGANVMDVTFFLPGTNTPATVTGFGAVFSDVDLAATTSIQFFDANGNTISTATAAKSPAAANAGFSFLGGFESTGQATVGKVRITYGNTPAGAAETAANDVVVADDFLYGEPRALVAAAAATAYALSGTKLFALSTTGATAATPVTITNVAAGETLVGIDVRPQNGQLYALGIDAANDKGTLYAVSTRTGFAAVVGTAGGVAFTDGVNPTDLPDPATVAYDIDFNPAVDRVRVVTGSGLNFRLNPNTGAGVDGDNTGLTTGTVTGTNPDGPVLGGTTTLSGAAYTNNAPNNGNVTTLYTVDTTTESLFIQNPANVGTQTLGVPLTLGGAPVTTSDIAGFDIPAGVNAAASNTAVTAGSGFVVATVGGVTQLYAVDLVTGALTAAGKIGDGTAVIDSFAVQSDLGGTPAVGLSADALSLVRFNTATTGTTTTVAVAGVTAGETLVGLDFRPQTGQLYGLGVDAANDKGTLYLIDPQTAVATAVGTAGQIAFVTAVPAAVDLPAAGYGFDFNPTVDRIRVTTASGLTFRLNPNTGAGVDGDLGGAAGSVAGANTDGLITGAAGVSGAAYTNSFGQPLTGGVTTLYTLDGATDKLFIQNPPNAGTQSAGVVVTLNGATLDFTDANGFDIAGSVRVAASNAVAVGTGTAALTVGGTTSLFAIDLTTGKATLLGAVPAGLSGLTIGDVPAGVVTFGTPVVTVSESAAVANVTLFRTGGTGGPLTVTVNLTGGSAQSGADFVATPVVVTFADGQSTATAAVPLFGDALAEGTETFTATIAAVTGGAVAGGLTTATVALTDDDAQLATTVAYALAGNSLLTFDTANPARALAAVPITYAVGSMPAVAETFVGLDIRPQTGTLYALGYEPVAGTVQLYTISQRTGVATAVGTAGTFVDAGGTAVRVGVNAATRFGFDFNPTVDRIRVVTTNGQNFRINPNTGALVDGNLGGAAAVPGLNMDGAINGGTTTADETAYTNNAANVSVTTQYTLDASTDKLFVQNPPNAGTQVNGVSITENGAALDFTAATGFDIPSLVASVTANGGAVGFGYATLLVGGVNKLYQIDLPTGNATFVDTVSDGTGTINGFAVASDAANGGLPAVGLTGDGSKLVRFNTNLVAAPTPPVLITGVTAGESLVGIDYRPATGQLYALGIDGALDQGTVYVLDPQTGAATAVGTAGSVKFVQMDGTTKVDLTDPAAGGYGFDFNPTVDRIRVVSTTGLNFRVNPITGAPVDGDLGGAAGSVTGVNTDAAVSGATGLAGAAYTNSFAGATKTTQYVLDPTTDKLFIQNPPNAGTVTNGLAITLAGAPLDFTAVSGFDIPAGVQVTTSGAAAAGTGFATLVVGGKTNLYAIDLTTGKATDLGLVGDGTTAFTGLAVGDAGSAGVVQFSAATFTAAENAGPAVLTLTRSNGSGAVTVTVELFQSTANSTDFDPTPITVTFADGQTTATANVPLIDDASFEPTEDFLAVITGVSGGAAVGTNAAVVVAITDDDTMPTVTIGNVGVTEGNSGTVTATFTVTLSAASGFDITVDFKTLGLTATAGVDFVAAMGTVTFLAGETTQTIEVTVNGDTLFEGDETFTVTLSNPTNAALGVVGFVGTGTITDDDAPPTLSIGNVTVVEGNAGTSTATFTVTLSAASSVPVTVTFATANGTADATDFTAATGTLTFMPGELTKTIAVTIAGDTTAEANETFTVTLSAPTGATLGTAVGTGTITNDDAAAGPTVSIANATVTEGNAGTTTLTFTLTLSAASLVPVTVTFTSSDGTATAGSDYTARTGTQTFAPGQTTAVLSFDITGDTAAEANETFFVTLSNPDGGATLAGTGKATGTIADDDTVRTVSIADVTIVEGNSGTSVATFTITLSAASSTDVTVLVATADGTATNGSDYVRVPSVLVTIPAGMTTATLQVTINGDTNAEASETFTVTLSSPTGATLGRATATGTITDDDTPVNTPPTITAITNQTTTSGVAVGPLTFTVGDAQTAATALTVTATSSNTTLVPASGIVVTGSGATRMVTVTPAAGQVGTATITLAVSDGTATTMTTFTVTANAAATVALVGVPPFAVGTDVGGNGAVTFYNPDKTVRFTTQPFGNFTGGVRTAVGDFNGDGVPDVAVGTGPGRATQVIVLSGVDGKTQLFSVAPFEATFTGGVFVAAGDLNGDGKADLVITPDEGGGPRVDVYSGAGFGKFASFFGIDDVNFRGGARAATGDMNGDGRTDLLVAAGFGGGPRVAAFDGKSIGGTPVKLFNDFFAFEQALRNGVFITAGDLDADGRADLIAGGGPGGGPRVTAFSAANLISSGGGTQTQLANFFGGDVNNRGGIRVAVKNLDGDARADIVVGSGAGAGSRVTAYLGSAISPSGTPASTFDFDSVSGFSGGVFVG